MSTFCLLIVLHLYKHTLSFLDMSSALEGLRADGILGMAPTSQMTKADLLIEDLYD